jgi:transposase
LCDELATVWQWDIRQAHPGFVKRMAGKPDKTDHGDARILADLVRLDYVPEVWLAPPAIRDLKRVTRHRQQLVDQRRAEKLRLRSLLRECRVKLAANPWTRAWWKQLHVTALPENARWVAGRHEAAIRRLDAEIAEVETRLESLVTDDPIVVKLRLQKGIGLITAAVLRAEIGCFDRFRHGKQLARYCGLTPRNASSGERQADAGLVKAGSVQLRTVLIEAAHRLARLDPRWKQFKADLRARGKSGSVIAAAVANRWVRGLLHQMKTETPATAA